MDGSTSPISREARDYGFPFRFDVTLDREGRVQTAHEISVNTSSYDDDEAGEVAASAMASGEG